MIANVLLRHLQLSLLLLLLHLPVNFTVNFNIRKQFVLFIFLLLLFHMLIQLFLLMLKFQKVLQFFMLILIVPSLIGIGQFWFKCILQSYHIPHCQILLLVSPTLKLDSLISWKLMFGIYGCGLLELLGGVQWFLDRHLLSRIIIRISFDKWA